MILPVGEKRFTELVDVHTQEGRYSTSCPFRSESTISSEPAIVNDARAVGRSPGTVGKMRVRNFAHKFPQLNKLEPPLRKQSFSDGDVAVSRVICLHDNSVVTD